MLDFARRASPSSKDIHFTTSAGQGEHKWKIIQYGIAYFHLSSVLKSPSQEKGFRVKQCKVIDGRKKKQTLPSGAELEMVAAPTRESLRVLRAFVCDYDLVIPRTQQEGGSSPGTQGPE